jgi:hypothetical protein
MFSLETPTPVTTTRRATGGPRTPWSMGPKPIFPRKPFWTPHGSSLLMGLCRGGYDARMWTPSTNSDDKRRPEMHVTTERPGTATNGSCTVGSPRSRPGPRASTEPKRVPQTLPQLRGTLQGDGNMPTRGGVHLAITKGMPFPSHGTWSISVSPAHRSKPEGLSFSSFVIRFCIRVRQPGEVRPHKPGLLVYTHACQVIKKRFTPSDVLL